MRSHYTAFGFAVVLTFAVFALWFILGERSRTPTNGPAPSDVPPGTTPRQPDSLVPPTLVR